MEILFRFSASYSDYSLIFLEKPMPRSGFDLLGKSKVIMGIAVLHY